MTSANGVYNPYLHRHAHGAAAHIAGAIGVIMDVLVTGSSGLIGSEAVEHYDRRGHRVIGVDNNMRRQFFGEAGDTHWNRDRLLAKTRQFIHFDLDIRDREAVDQLFSNYAFDLIIHCAAQSSNDKAREIPLIDFDVNAVGTMNLLEATRRSHPEAVFIFMSTNKVYGDAPNEVPLVEKETRWEYARSEDFDGISETCRIDRCLHSLSGASKVAADVMAQEYGRYFGLPVGVFRGGCLTGSSHAGVEHGFLNHLVKIAVAGQPYTIYGYKGKQVRDQIHSTDVIAAFDAFTADPKPGEVYNLGGGRENSISVLECLEMVEELLGRPVQRRYVGQHRIGDHICYISNLRKIRRDFPEWEIRTSLQEIVSEMVRAEVDRTRLTREIPTTEVGAA